MFVIYRRDSIDGILNRNQFLESIDIFNRNQGF